jgi:hypothetical protein
MPGLLVLENKLFVSNILEIIIKSSLRKPPRMAAFPGKRGENEL